MAYKYKDLVRDEAKTVSCPMCSALPMQPCVSARKSEPRKSVHQSRIDAYRGLSLSLPDAILPKMDQH